MARVLRTDVVLAVVLSSIGLTEAVLGLTGRREPWYVVLTVAVVGASVLLRRSRPVVAVGALVPVLLVQAAVGSDLPGGFAEPLAVLLVVYAVGSGVRGRLGALLIVLVLISIAGVIALGDARAGNFVYAVTVVVASWGAGYAVRVADERSALNAERASQRERNRIAAELHDVVSHHVSAMVVQAGAERRELPGDSPIATTLVAIESQGRQTLTELRRLLGVLRLEDGAPLAPQPGIADLPALVEGCRATGLAVTLESEGQPRPVDLSLSLAVYRVVQEALTNVRKHAGTPAARVTLRWLAHELEVEVADSGQPRRPRVLPGSGSGLRAMQERVSAYGGTLTSGQVVDGFRVLATLPLETR